MKKIYIAVLLIVSILLSGYFITISTNDVNASGTQMETNSHNKSVDTYFDSEDCGFDVNDLVATYTYIIGSRNKQENLLSYL